jgi:hypothetical protein
MDIVQELSIREKACQDYDKFLIAEIKEALADSLTEKFLDENGHDFAEGYRTALEYMFQIIDDYDYNTLKG